MTPATINERKSSDRDGDTPRKIRKKFIDAPRIDSHKVTVKVGSQERGFTIDEEKLKEHSGFFKAALKKEWKEGQERAISLPDQKDPELFEIIYHFIKTGAMHTENEGDSLGGERDSVVRVADLWRLGEVLLSTSLQDAVADTIREKVDDGNWPANIFETITRQMVSTRRPANS